MREYDNKLLTKILFQYLYDNYRKSEDILNYLEEHGVSITDREFRKYVENYRKEDHEMYLISDNSGYKFTIDKEKIKKSCFNKIKNGVSQIKNAKLQLKYLSENDQIEIEGFLNKELNIQELVHKELSIEEKKEQTNLFGWMS